MCLTVTFVSKQPQKVFNIVLVLTEIHPVGDQLESIIYV